MRLLIYTLALISAFFVSKSFSSEPDLDSLVPANQDTVPCSGYYLTGSTYDGSTKVCGYSKTENDLASCSIAVSTVLPRTERGGYFTKEYKDAFCEVGGGRVNAYQNVTTIFDEQDTPDSDSRYSLNLRSKNLSGELSYLCPPDGHPEHKISVGSSCAKVLLDKDCPPGYHSKAVSKAMGSSDCMPKECPPDGSAESLYSSPLLGSAFSGGGTYCNDGCAYNVSASNILIGSGSHARGTSLGSACGDKPYDNKKLADDNDSSCSKSTDSNGVSILSCANGNTDKPTPDAPDFNNDDSKSDETEKPKDDLVNCAEGDMVCQMDNLKKQNANDTKTKLENDNKNHNLLVDTLTKNTKEIKTAIDGFVLTFDIAAKKGERQGEIELTKLDQIIATLKTGNQIATDKPVSGGGGGSGTGTGPNDGTCVGEDCSDDSKYDGDCEGDLCDLDIVSELEESDEKILDWFDEKIDMPTEATSLFSKYRNLISSNFASFTGSCIPFSITVSLAGNSKNILIDQHCEPYETYFKPVIEWFLWSLTALASLNILSQSFRTFSYT